VVSPQLRKKHRKLTSEQEQILRQALTVHYFSDTLYYPVPPAVYLATPAGKADLTDHLVNRLHSFRTFVVPWLESIFPLAGAKILEIGCGTGASTISLSEQGARVVGVDESEGALEAARVRCGLYGLGAEFIKANAADLKDIANEGEFTAIIFFAVLEHMTWQERSASLRAAWELLRKGQHLIVIETPNRLWHTDHHTTGEPFFHWLQDDMAFAYSRYTKRQIFNEIFREATEESKIRFARWGRGVSYHDFVLSLDLPAESLPIESYLQLFLRRRRFEQVLRRFSRVRRDERRLRNAAPKIHPGFLCTDLNLALRKP
jgi:S-adenosylmethionine-dependent methyltransferase